MIFELRLSLIGDRSAKLLEFNNGGPFRYWVDLVKRVDNAGNITCYTYDALHRQLSSSYSGPNATTNRYFVYDTANVNGQSMTNAKGRMAEAYTAACATCTKLTDEGMGYGALGELNQYYESTPHSAGYYSVPTTFWPNGQVASLGPFLNESQVTITPDGEGRPLTISGNAQNIQYNSASQPTQVMTSCGGAGGTCYPITYQYDPNTLRMTQFTAAMNGTVSGNLYWNPNGSLQKQVVTDSNNSANSQTCTYSADDLSRLASANCGSVWSQTFSYDAFGNITKTGSISWMPGYTASTNHYALGGTTYDADGNLLTDSLGHTYTWDAEGKQLSTTNGGFGFTYDAFGHLVELSVNGSYSRSYVTLGKFKLSAVGQVANYSETPLPGGSVVSQNGGAAGAQFADWLGTIRAFFTYTGTEGSSTAHAPFGETYANDGGYPSGFTGQGGPGWGNGDDGNIPSTMYWFPERQYSSGQGRWLSPDPSGLAAADPSNPQSWNRYAYVLNNPLASIDPNGLDCVYDTSMDNTDGINGLIVGGFLIKPGDCASDTDNGFYFDGTVDPTSVEGTTNGDLVATVGGNTTCSGECNVVVNVSAVFDPVGTTTSNLDGNPYSTGCLVAVSCGPTPRTHGFGHCVVTVRQSQNGPYLACDGGPSGSVWNSRLQVGCLHGGAPGPNTFYMNDSCAAAACIPGAASNINDANHWYSFGVQNSNNAASWMLSQCGINVTLPVWGPQ